MSQWDSCQLGEIADIQTGPFGSQLHASDYVKTGIPSIMPTNIGNNLNIDEEGIVRVKADDVKRLSRYIVRENDIVYSRRGDVEKCAFIKKEQDGWLCGTGCLRVRFRGKNLVPKFYAYYLSTQEMRGWISGHAVGSTMPNLNSSILERVPLVLPRYEEQKAIASVLSSLDDKIDFLHRQNKTLERMAETLFRKYYIVDAKLDWETTTLGEVIEICGGSTPKTEEKQFWNGDIPWTSPRDLTGKTSVFMFDTDRKITEKGLATISSGLLPEGALLLSSRAPIGYLAITCLKVAINQGYIAILPNKIGNYFFYLWCKANMEVIKSAANGSVFQEISKSVFRTLPFVLPDKELLSQFTEMVSPIFDKMRQNQIQIMTLERLRNTLLPKLMSGEVRVEV